MLPQNPIHHAKFAAIRSAINAHEVEKNNTNMNDYSYFPPTKVMLRLLPTILCSRAGYSCGLFSQRHFGNPLSLQDNAFFFSVQNTLKTQAASMQFDSRNENVQSSNAATSASKLPHVRRFVRWAWENLRWCLWKRTKKNWKFENANML